MKKIKYEAVFEGDHAQMSYLPIEAINETEADKVALKHARDNDLLYIVLRRNNKNII